jgi:hypothetical protein
VTANNTIEVTRSGSYVTAVNSKCNIRVQFDGVHLVDMNKIWIFPHVKEYFLRKCVYR